MNKLMDMHVRTHVVSVDDYTHTHAHTHTHKLHMPQTLAIAKTFATGAIFFQELSKKRT